MAKKEPLYPHVPKGKQAKANVPFVNTGQRVRYTGHSKYRYSDMPEGAWIEHGIEGAVMEYHAALAPFGDIKGIPEWATVLWDIGGKTAIDPQYENIDWIRV